MGVFIAFGYFWKLSFIFIIQQIESIVKMKKVPQNSPSTHSSSYVKMYATDWLNRRQVVVLEKTNHWPRCVLAHNRIGVHC